MSLIHEYLSLGTDIVTPKEFCEDIHFSGFSKEHNRKVTRMRRIAAEIDRKCPELKNDFCKLLSHENAGIRLWVAHHVLEVMHCDKPCRIAALRVIRYHAKTEKLRMALVKKYG